MEAASSGRTSLTVCDLKVLTPPIQSAAGGGVLDKRLCLPSSSSSTLNNGSLLLDFKFLHTFSGRCIFSDPEVGKLDTKAAESGLLPEPPLSEEEQALLVSVAP